MHKKKKMKNVVDFPIVQISISFSKEVDRRYCLEYYYYYYYYMVGREVVVEEEQQQGCWQGSRTCYCRGG